MHFLKTMLKQVQTRMKIINIKSNFFRFLRNISNKHGAHSKLTQIMHFPLLAIFL